MPEARPRQSSISARLRPPKAHIPYRGDTLEVTKKTGIKVAHNPGSDDFEAYEHFAKQADKMTPYKVKGRKKNDPPQEEEQEDEGDSDMEIDSPMNYIANSRQPTSPISRVGFMSRPVARISGNQFDELPSPRTRSATKSRRSTFTTGPSHLSQQLLASDDDPVSARTRRTTNGYEDDMSIDTGFVDDDQHLSFTELDQDVADDDDEQEEEEPHVESPPRKKRKSDEPSPKRNKGKNVEREVSPEELPPATQSPDPEQLDPAVDESAEEEEEQVPVSAKKTKLDKGKAKAKGKTRGETRKESHREGVRRSQRRPIKPLDWWRNEKYVYERPAQGSTLVPHIKEIIRIPEEPKEPLGKHKRKRGRSRTAQPMGKDKPNREGGLNRGESAVDDNPEEGWDDKTPAVSMVIDWKTKEPCDKRITCLAKNVKPQPAIGNEWFFQRIFGDDSFIAAGQLIIPVHKRKPSKTTKDNTYIFYVIEGAINLKVYEKSMILCTGAMFMIPRGNTYFIENIGERDAKLFFTQARKEDRDAAEGSASPRKVSVRPSSEAAPPKAPASKTGKRATTAT
ncbi:Mif2/CENP-C like-domain-containing protein [Rhodocollybia butyracea]|uniref:CENP-C homolog n=1 Tax=Rhodocollybia butyracea TaxID=206335 RepID=A0A9P5Q8X4_9AGAR|nr:Mif2/CENP-C like-domain-containing protein [Rhodocollybia butyracea]